MPFSDSLSCDVDIALHPNLEVPAIQLQSLIVKIQALNNHMLHVFLHYYCVLHWILDCVIEGGKEKGKTLFGGELFYLDFEFMQVEGKGSSSEADSVWCEILAIEMEAIHRHNY